MEEGEEEDEMSSEEHMYDEDDMLLVKKEEEEQMEMDDGVVKNGVEHLEPIAGMETPYHLILNSKQGEIYVYMV